MPFIANLSPAWIETLYRQWHEKPRTAAGGLEGFFRWI